MSFTIDPLATDGGRAAAILPLARVKAHVAVEADVTEFDDLLGLFRDAAVEAVEARTGKLLSRETVTWRGDFPASGDRLRLGRGPLVSVTSIAGFDGSGAAVTIATSDVIARVGGSWLAPVSFWPVGWRAGTAAIVFVAGYDDNTRPAALLTAALMLAGHYWLNREAVVSGASVAELPEGVAAICDRYREVVI